MSKNNDVIVQSPHDFSTLVTQLMPATTVLHASQTDIDYTTGSVQCLIQDKISTSPSPRDRRTVVTPRGRRAARKLL